MPRPTRSRVASSRRGETSSVNPTSAPAQANKADETPMRSDSTDIYGVSDRELERQRKTKDNTASVGSRRSTRSRATVATTAVDATALETSKKRRDAAMNRLDDLTSTTTDAVDSSEVVGSPVVELGRKDLGMEASSLLGPRGGDGGGVSLSNMEIMDDEIFGNLDSSFDVTQYNDKDRTATSGTRSADTSTFSVGVFRRQTRRRQSSIVGKDDAPIRPSSRGPTTPGLSTTFSLGNFKRRQRQPSILMSSAQKATLGLQQSRAASEEVGNENAVESEGEGEESFFPEAEGTPIRPSQGRKSMLQDMEDEVEADGQRETRSRKRKSTEAHEVEAAKRQAVEAAEEDEAIHQSIEMDERSSPPSFIERRRTSPELDSDILAPPASSSSREGSPTVWPSLRDLGKKRHRQPPSRARKATPVLEDDMSDVSEPPSLTHSPNIKATKVIAKDKRKESPKFSTADLEALLPRRRHKARQDDKGDEYQLSESEQEQRAPRAAKKSGRSLHGTSKADQSNKAKQTAAPAKRPTRRTYGSRAFERENTAEGNSIEVAGRASTPLDDTAFEADVQDDTSNLDLGNELKAASRKFKEVDKWELDFEEVVEPSSDLPEGR